MSRKLGAGQAARNIQKTCQALSKYHTLRWTLTATVHRLCLSSNDGATDPGRAGPLTSSLSQFPSSESGPVKARPGVSPSLLPPPDPSPNDIHRCELPAIPRDPSFKCLYVSDAGSLPNAPTAPATCSGDPAGVSCSIQEARRPTGHPWTQGDVGRWGPNSSLWHPLAAAWSHARERGLPNPSSDCLSGRPLHPTPSFMFSTQPRSHLSEPHSESETQDQTGQSLYPGTQGPPGPAGSTHLSTLPPLPFTRILCARLNGPSRTMFRDPPWWPRG